MELGKLKERTANQFGGNLAKEATLMATPGLSTYGKEKIKEASALNTPPIFLPGTRRQELSGRQGAMLDKLAKHNETGDVAHEALIGSTLDALDFVFNMPNRAIAETADAARKRLDWAVQGGEGELPGYHPWDAAMREEKAPGVRYGGLDQTYQDAYKQAVGGRDLTETERLSLLGAGVISDIGVAGKLGKAIAPFKRVPASQAISENIGAALKQGGFELKPPDQRAFTLLKPTQAMHPHLEYAGRVSAEGKSLPQRIQWAREELQKTAHSMGATPEELAKMDQAFLERIGTEGKFLEKKGWGAEVGRRLQKPAPERISEVLNPTETTMPFGALQKPGKARDVASAWAWDRGAPQGVGDLVRQNQGQKLSGISQAEKDAKNLGKAFESPERGEQVSSWMDAYSTRAEADKWMRQSQALQQAGGPAPSPRLIQARSEVIDRLNDLEARGYAPKTPREAEAVKFMRQQFDDFRAQEQQALGDVGFVEEYLPRVETKASKDFAFKIVGRHQLGEGAGFTKERLPWETGVTLDGTPLHEFYKHPSAIYAARAKAHHMAMASAQSEADVLAHYARPLPAGISPEARAALKAQGVELYQAKYGANKGKMFLLDENAGRLLAKTTSKEEIGKFWKTYDGAHSWLKGRMTVLRPGFVMRNFFGGNLYNMWLGDVDILPNLNHASQVLGVKQARHFGPASKMEIGVQKLLSTGMNGGSKVGGRSVDEWIKLLEENKVISPGQIEYELGTASHELAKPSWKQWRPLKEDFALKNRAWNPFSQKFVVPQAIGGANRALENLSKVAVFMDRIKKGYTAREAADAVAKTLFNYDELSAVLGSQAVRRTMSFPIWQYKNMGLQFASMLARPDKFSQYLTARTGIQNIDPLDEKDLALAGAIPAEMRRAEPFMMPGARGSRENAASSSRAGCRPSAPSGWQDSTSSPRARSRTGVRAS